MGIAKSSARRGAETTCCDAVHRVATSGAGPGSVRSTPEYALGKVCVPSSQTFRHDSLVLSESSWCPASVPSWASNVAGAWLVVATDFFAALDCGSSFSRKQAFATDEASANSHTSSTMKAVLRLVRLLAKNFMVGANYL